MRVAVTNRMCISPIRGALYPADSLLANKAILPYLYPAMSNGSFVLLDDRGILAVSGPDRRPFLQGLVSNDVDKVGPQAGRYAALLTAQGKYLHDFIMVEAGESLWLDAEAARLGDLKRRLSIYRLRAKASLDERSDLAVAAVFGECVCSALGLSNEPGSARPFGDGVALVDPRLAALGARAILPRETARATLIDSGLCEAAFDMYDRLRLSLGIPDGSRDLLLEKSILLESGFDELNGVDWQKGCYIGQELTARTKYRGLVKKRLMPVNIDGPAPPPGTIVTSDGREVGEMRSSRDRLGLALLRIEPVLAGKQLEAATATLIPMKPSWMDLEGEAATEAREKVS
jgi:folate-binding protein YgfZ